MTSDGDGKFRGPPRSGAATRPARRLLGYVLGWALMQMVPDAKTYRLAPR